MRLLLDECVPKRELANRRDHARGWLTLSRRAQCLVPCVARALGSFEALGRFPKLPSIDQEPRGGTAVSAQTATDAHWLSMSDIGRLIRAGTLSSTALTEQMLDRIKRLDPTLESYATLMADAALDAARAADREMRAGTDRRPLHGVPIAVKDLCYTRGVRTMGATFVKATFVPHEDATVVAKLRDAGAVLLGKLNLTEGAMVGYHPERGIPRNPGTPVAGRAIRRVDRGWRSPPGCALAPSAPTPAVQSAIPRLPTGWSD